MYVPAEKKGYSALLLEIVQKAEVICFSNV